ALLDCRAAVFSRVLQLAGQTQSHGGLAALARGFQHPAHSQSCATLGTHFNRHLVSRTTNAARLHLDHRTHVLQGGLENRKRFTTLLLGDLIESTVYDPLGDGLLAV